MRKLPPALRFLFTGLVWFVLATALTWPLLPATTDFDDTWISKTGEGAEALGTITVQERIQLCMDHAFSSADGDLAKTLEVPTRCAFETLAWNDIEVLLLVIPLQAAFGPGAHWNGLFFVVIWLNLWAGFCFGRHFGGEAGRRGTLISGCVGALVMGLSPLVIINAYQGRPLQAMLFAFPPALIGIDRLLRGQGRFGTAIVTGIWIALLVQLYWYNAHFLVLLGLPLLAGLVTPGQRAKRLLRLVVAAGVALGLCWPSVQVYQEFSETGRLASSTEASASKAFPAPTSPDLTPEQDVLLKDSAPLEGITRATETWGQVERRNMAWIPAGLLAMALIGLISRPRRAWPWATVAALSWLLTLGPYPRSLASGDLAIPNLLYLFAYEHVPLLDGLRHPNRFVLPGLVALTALAALSAGHRGRRRLVTAAGSLGMLVWAGMASATAGLLPMEQSPFPIPPPLSELRNEPGLRLVHLPLSASLETGLDSSAFISWDNRILWLRMIHGADPRYSLPRQPGSPPPDDTKAWSRARTPLAARDAEAIQDLGSLLPKGLQSVDIDGILLDEAGFVLREGTKAGSLSYSAHSAALTAVLGPPAWEVEVDNGSFFPTRSRDGSAPRILRLALFRTPGT